MRRAASALAVILALTVAALADGPAPSTVLAAAAHKSDAAIGITINPEGRVSVTLAGDPPSAASLGKAAVFDVRIANQGFSTGILEAELVGSPPPRATLNFQPERLEGLPKETRTLRLTLNSTDLTDLTIAFRLRGEDPDLGGRDRIHFLMRADTDRQPIQP